MYVYNNLKMLKISYEMLHTLYTCSYVNDKNFVGLKWKDFFELYIAVGYINNYQLQKVGFGQGTSELPALNHFLPPIEVKISQLIITYAMQHHVV